MDTKLWMGSDFLVLDTLKCELKKQGADIIWAIDISMISADIKKEYDRALIIACVLSPEYLFRLTREEIADCSEFVEKENLTDSLAQWAAEYLVSKGYRAYAQSENNNRQNGLYDDTTKTTLLPHKAISLLGSIGWIGKNDLLITKEYGCAISMCTVLTNSPFPTANGPIIPPKCGNCTICRDICPTNAIAGCTWEKGISRDLLVDAFLCTCCLKCLVHCPWSQRYMMNQLST